MIETAEAGHIEESITKKPIVNGTGTHTQYSNDLKRAISESDFEQSPVLNPNLNFFGILFPACDLTIAN